MNLILKKQIYKTLILIQIFIVSYPSSAVSASKKICGNIYFKANQYVSFSETEKRLVCGDSKVEEWSDIPFYQSQYYLKNFLESRGYHNPVFYEEDENLIVDRGKLSRIKSVVLSGPLYSIKLSKKNRKIGEKLTSVNLDKIENAVISKLQKKGYPCSSVETSADPQTGEVVLIVDLGAKNNFGKINQENITGLIPGVTQRYHAFKDDWVFDPDLLTLTERRTLEDGIVQNTHFLLRCDENKFIINQKFISRKPRLFGFGFGFNTEEYFIAKITWKHARLGKTGSSLDLFALGSYRRQEFRTTLKWYLLPFPTRFHLKPLISILREYEKSYDTITAKLQIFPTMSWERKNLSMNLSIGPTLKYIRVLEGAGLKNSYWFPLESEFNIVNHDFELYRKEPISGYQISLLGDFNSSKLGSSATVQNLELRFTYLYNFLNLDPHYVILALRGAFNTLITKKDLENLNRIPVNYFSFLGGSQNLRGFSRKELPKNSNGALMSYFVGFETRFTNILPLKFQPLLLFDLGALSEVSSFKPEKPLYWSFGGGLRWASPVGPFRFTIAHGYTAGLNQVTGDVSHLQLYFSFGEEF